LPGGSFRFLDLLLPYPNLNNDKSVILSGAFFQRSRRTCFRALAPPTFTAQARSGSPSASASGSLHWRLTLAKPRIGWLPHSPAPGPPRAFRTAGRNRTSGTSALILRRFPSGWAGWQSLACSSWSAATKPPFSGTADPKRITRPGLFHQLSIPARCNTFFSWYAAAEVSHSHSSVFQVCSLGDSPSSSSSGRACWPTSHPGRHRWQTRRSWRSVVSCRRLEHQAHPDRGSSTRSAEPAELSPFRSPKLSAVVQVPIEHAAVMLVSLLPFFCRVICMSSSIAVFAALDLYLRPAQRYNRMSSKPT